MRKILLIAVSFGLLFLQVGCAGKKVRTLKEQVSAQEGEIAALKAENDTLRTRLTESEETTKVLRELISAKDETIVRQEESMRDMQLQKMEMEARLEVKPSAATPQRKPVAPPAPAVKTTGNYKADYDHALSLFRGNRYDQAADHFRTLAERDRSHDLADNAQFWLGECYYAQAQYESAIAEFEKVFAFPNTNKADAAQIKIGLCYMELGSYPEAREQLIRLLSTYPASEYVPRARALLEKIP